MHHNYKSCYERTSRRTFDLKFQGSGVATIFGPPANNLFGPQPGQGVTATTSSWRALAGPFSPADPPAVAGPAGPSLRHCFKVIRQGHVIYFSICGFFDLNLVENDTNLITLSHLHQKISRLTNNGKNSVFWPPLCTYDVMTYVTWQRQDDVTYVKMCLPSLETDTMRRFPPLESSKKLQGKNAYPPPWASEG